ncbi:MAG: FkbM family methyltransferase, partial [Tannerella sp.]|nr:FkbM family methyltransferase [Tannerella sp.]
IHGAIPYYFAKYFNPESPNLKYYKYIKNNGYKRHIYEFRHEYDNKIVDIQKDDVKDLYYIIHTNNKRLYFRRGLLPEKMKGMYKALMMEQDIRSPHHYFDNFDEVKNCVFVDIGSAEGFSSLEVIENATHIYLFEQDPKWIEALEATFEPWKDKITIVRKYVSDYDDENHQTLDTFFKDQSKENLFLKMDIEGDERKALNGCKELFSSAKNLNFAISSYHMEDDEKVISTFLDRYNCTYLNRRGYFRHKYRSVVIRGEKNSSFA